MPTIFDVLNQLEFLRGLSALYLVLITAVIVVVAWDGRLALIALAGNYLAAGLLFVDLLDPRLAAVKVLNGLFVCLILYMTGRQVNWGRLPVDVSPEEVEDLRREQRVHLGPLHIPANAPLRLLLAMIIVVIVFSLGQRPALQLPTITEGLRHLNLAIYLLAGLGLLGMAFNADPLPAGMGMLLFFTGFELFYSGLEQSIAMLIALALVTLGLALAISYLTQAYHALPALLD